jgi:hypothetical protein
VAALVCAVPGPGNIKPPPSCAEQGAMNAKEIEASAIQSVRSLRIVVSMTSGPERPDAAKGDQRSPDAMD